MLFDWYCHVSPTRGSFGDSATAGGASGRTYNVTRPPAFSVSPPCGFCATTESAAGDVNGSALPSRTRLSNPSLPRSASASGRALPIKFGTVTSCVAGGLARISTSSERLTTAPAALRALSTYVLLTSAGTCTHSFVNGFTVPGYGVIVALAALSTP